MHPPSHRSNPSHTAPTAPHPDPSAQLSAITNPFPPGKSTACGVPQVTWSGNAIITIASSAPSNNWTTFAATSTPIRKIGGSINCGNQNNAVMRWDKRYLVRRCLSGWRDRPMPSIVVKHASEKVDRVLQRRDENINFLTGVVEIQALPRCGSHAQNSV